MSMAGALLSYVVMCLTPVLVFGVAAAALSPDDNRLKRLGGWAVQRVSDVRRPPGPTVWGSDPFAVLAVQTRLEQLTVEIFVLELNPQTWARAHHLEAALAAYDDLLDEACRLAGVPVPALERGTERRLRQEVELRSRGWTW